MTSISIYTPNSVSLGFDTASNGLLDLLLTTETQRDADSLLNSGEPTRWMNVLMQSSAKLSTSISTYYEKSLDKPCSKPPPPHS